MGWLKKIRGVVSGNSGDDQEWIAIDGVGDTSALLRCIEQTMPRDAMLNIVKPRSAEVEGYLQQHKTDASNPAEGDYYLAMSGSAIAHLAQLVEQIMPEPAFGAVLVTHNGRNLLEAYRRDLNEDVVWLSASLPEATLANARKALDVIARQCAAAAVPQPNGLPQARSA
jgi:hypothetical protein